MIIPSLCPPPSNANDSNDDEWGCHQVQDTVVQTQRWFLTQLLRRFSTKRTLGDAIERCCTTKKQTKNYRFEFHGTKITMFEG
jgi:hypothetical protein